MINVCCIEYAAIQYKHYEDSSACDKINKDYSAWFKIKRDIRQECVALPWLVNMFFFN